MHLGQKLMFLQQKKFKQKKFFSRFFLIQNFFLKFKKKSVSIISVTKIFVQFYAKGCIMALSYVQRIFLTIFVYEIQLQFRINIYILISGGIVSLKIEKYNQFPFEWAILHPCSIKIGDTTSILVTDIIETLFFLNSKKKFWIKKKTGKKFFEFFFWIFFCCTSINFCPRCMLTSSIFR